jgi:hypothetical protein
VEGGVQVRNITFRTSGGGWGGGGVEALNN